ncbi:cysteine-rich CWC family protein [Paraburkholderia fungorum]|uniref:cysteine-rich CWC family protein n=1 Tax=Paraburkholderia fungorum TaxID=134537 RepID=UPI0038BA5F88
MKLSASRTESSALCPRCGHAFDCAMHAVPFNCWCREMPALPADRVDPSGRCLCPECLAAELARAVHPAPGAGSP